MVREEDSQSIDPELERLREKNAKGTLNVLSDVLADPRVQKTIKKALFGETVKNSIVLACLLMGFFKIYDVVKFLMGFNWVGDLTTSLILISIGLIYIIKNIFLVNQNGD